MAYKRVGTPMAQKKVSTPRTVAQKREKTPTMAAKRTKTPR